MEMAEAASERNYSSQYSEFPIIVRCLFGIQEFLVCLFDSARMDIFGASMSKLWTDRNETVPNSSTKGRLWHRTLP